MESFDLFLCPISHQQLSDLSTGQIKSLNSEIQRGERLHADGSAIVHGCLNRVIGTSDLRYCYRVDENIFCLLPGLAITRAEDAILKEQDAAKKIVQTFYNEFGWVRNQEGKFKDTAAFTVPSRVADSYIDACNARVGAELRQGKYLLDAASGAIPLASYLPYSRNYDRRICIDFSIRALREARAKLPDGRGVYVLGDITCLPIREGVIDDAISLHTLYHVPRDLQTQAVDELVRTLKPGGKLAGC